MMKTILEYFEKTTSLYPDKVAFTDDVRESTFLETMIKAKKIGSYLVEYGSQKPVAIFIDKNCDCIDSILGTLYSRNFYVVIDINSPFDRIQKILNLLGDVVIIMSKNLQKKFCEVFNAYDNILFYEDIVANDISEELLYDVRKTMVDVDIAYLLFTSGSTGNPKGAVISHRALISYIDWVTAEFDFNSETVFASQTPLYFSMSVTDFYSTIKCACTYHILNKSLFMFPLNLIKVLNDKKVNTIYWVPTALSIVANWDAFKYMKPEYLKKVLFAGEVMPTKQLNYWINYLSSVEYANLFGPTETTDICTFYRVDRRFRDGESLPIGKPCDNCEILIVDEFGNLASGEGEMLVKGSFLANGYYNDIEKTNEVFIQNPLNKEFPEIVYKTGDIVKYNDNNELIYIGRKDFQVKRNGYRIELGEIEACVNSIDKVKGVACVYSSKFDILVCFYEGGPSDTEIVFSVLRDNVPQYMIPNKIIRVSTLAKNSNGKIDRKYLINMVENN